MVVARSSYSKQKIRTLLLLEKSSDFVVVVHLQGLEPWAHWLREQATGSSQFMEVSSHRYFWAKQRSFSPGNFCTLCRILQQKAPSARFETVQNPCRNRALTSRQIKITLSPTDLTALVWVTANSSQQHRNTAFSPENIFYCVFETHWWFSPWRREKAPLHPFQFKEKCKIYYDHELLPLWDYSGCTLRESCFKPVNQRKIKKS